MSGAGQMTDYGTDGNPVAAVGQRRPHTAHGARAGFPSSSQQQPQLQQQQAGGVYSNGGGSGAVDPNKQQAGMYDGEEVKKKKLKRKIIKNKYVFPVCYVLIGFSSFHEYCLLINHTFNIYFNISPLILFF